MNERSNKNNRWMLIALLALFLAPLLAALYLNSSWSQWQPGATRNYGELIQPVLPIAGLDFLQEQRRQARWTLLLIDCRVDCAARLDELARTHRALGRHEDKLTVAAAGAPEPVPSAVAVIDDPERVLWAALAERSLPQQGLYLIDPLGNLMMRFPDRYQAGQVLEDLERLLKYSKFKPQ